MGWCYPEYRRLRTVLMHSPGREIDLISPKSYGKFLFEDAVDKEEFQRQHENLVRTLRSEGVQVLLVTELLSQKPDILKMAGGLPNLTYTRDLVAVTTKGPITMRMGNPVRRREPEIAEVALEQVGLRRLMRVNAPGTLEGGDLIFLDEDTLLLGVGNRTNRSGFQQLLNAAMKSGLRRVVAIPLPPWVIHLDGTMMLVDRDLALVHPRSIRCSARIYEEGKLTGRILVYTCLRGFGMRLIEVTDYERKRRATNVIAISPRKVVGYAGNSRVRRELTMNGVDFIEIEGSELVRGAGGPRCLTAPVLRD